MPGLEVDQEKPVVTSGATGAMEIIVSRAEGSTDTTQPLAFPAL
jgi:hypothetical protein